MTSKPIIYCCFPRPGIMFMSLVFGFLGLLTNVPAIFSSNFFHIHCFSGFVNFICCIVAISSTIAYFYSTYLAYKRRYKPYTSLLYIFWADILVQAYKGVTFLKYLYEKPIPHMDVKTEMPYNATEHSQFTEEQYYKLFDTTANVTLTVIPFVLAFIVMFPFLNKVYFIVKLKAYVDYITYKKEEARSMDAVDLPHKLPECSQ